MIKLGLFIILLVASSCGHQKTSSNNQFHTPFLDGGRLIYDCGSSQSFIEFLNEEFGEPTARLIREFPRESSGDKIKIMGYSWSNNVRYSSDRRNNPLITINITTHYQPQLSEERIVGIRVPTSTNEIFNNLPDEIQNAAQRARNGGQYDIRGRISYINWGEGVGPHYLVGYQDNATVFYSCSIDFEPDLEI